MSDLFAKTVRRGNNVEAITELLPEDILLEPAAFPGHRDPHLWGEPALWMTTVASVVSSLAEYAPRGKADQEQRGAAIEKEYEQLVVWAKKRVEELPANQRVLITSHDPLDYFGRAIGLAVVGVRGISTVSEAGLAAITRIVNFIKNRKLKAIFVESNISPATTERISNDAAVKIGGELFSDALGTPGMKETSGGATCDLGSHEG